MFEKLTDVFTAAAVKYLTAVDANPHKSHQHEIGGLIKAGIGALLGVPRDGTKQKFQSTMVYLSDSDEEPVIIEDNVSWYDTRFDDPTRGPEWRLYYSTNAVSELFNETDFMLIALTHDRNLLLIFCPQGSQAEIQLRSLFGASETAIVDKLKAVPIYTTQLVIPIRLMLARYGIELECRKDDDNYLSQKLVEKFGNHFPTTKSFSLFARTLSDNLNAIEDPDATLLQWMNDEERIFRLLERHIVKTRLAEGFGENGDDVDEFIKVSLSIQNRRKSRVGHAFENHIEEILKQNNISFERGVHTEGKQKPDFLFPCRQAYIDPVYPAENLRMLGAKTTCKERWRQILAEADRIEHKHLITLEPSVSTDQTDEMQQKHVQLVVPTAIQATYKPAQQEWLMSFKTFIENV